MITFRVNGEHMEAEEQVPITWILAEGGHDPDSVRGIAVALNDRVVRREDWGTTMVDRGDRVEIVSARQGG